MRLVKIIGALFAFYPVLLAQQSNSVWIVTSDMLNVRSGPGVNYPVLTELQFGQPVLIIEKTDANWWKIAIDGIEGYASSKYLQPDTALQPADIVGWEKMDIFSGSKPDCYNINPQYDKNIDNYLKVNVGSHTDVVIKVIDKSDENCIRIVYINSSDAYHIRNIPQGRYYLKIAYGSDFRKKIIDGLCHVKFLRNPLYEKGEEILDYHVEETETQVGNDIYTNTSIPSYELWLDVMWNTAQNNFDSHKISEEEFNK